jgi:CcmD family protein
MKNFFFFFLILFLNLHAFAQAPEVEMADAMRANGKIYVVVGIVMIVLVGFITYLVLVDRKIAKLEKEIKK